jgi:hypothetical protein
LLLSVDFISETVEDIGNPLTFYQLLSIQSIQRNKNKFKEIKTHQNGMKNKNSENLGKWTVFRNKIVQTI